MPKKRKTEPESSSSDSDNASDSESSISDGSDDSSAISEEEVNVEFDGTSPLEEDFHGILNLLHQLFVTLRITASPLVDHILKQNHIGSVLKIVDNDENEIYGLTTGVVMETGNAFFSELTDALSKKMEDSDSSVAVKFKAALNNRKTLFLVNERFINVPTELAAPLLSSLRDDLVAVQAQTQKGKENAAFRDLEQIMVVCKTLERVSDPEDAFPSSQPTAKKTKGSKKKKRKKNKQDVVSNPDGPKLEFVNAEEELFQKVASFRFSYSVVEATGLACGRTWQNEEELMKTYRTVLLLPFTRLGALLEDVEQFVGA